MYCVTAVVAVRQLMNAVPDVRVDDVGAAPERHQLDVLGDLSCFKTIVWYNDFIFVKV
jgi:hypothetical protein